MNSVTPKRSRNPSIGNSSGGVKNIGLYADGSRAPAWTSKKFGSSVQSVAFAPDVLALGRLLLAVGLEDGNIQLLRLQSRMNEECFEVIRSEKIWEAPLHQQHSAAVRHLAWQATAQADKFFLASAGDDHAIHVYEVKA